MTDPDPTSAAPPTPAASPTSPTPGASTEPPATSSRTELLPSTFLGVPAATLDTVDAEQVVIVGAPFDWGATGRPGARFGPKAIREGDYLPLDGSRPHLTAGVDPLRELRVVDVGDVLMPIGYIEESLEAITAAVTSVTDQGGIPVVLGGDHTITFAAATGVARTHGAGQVALVHFDAHADTGETHFGHLHGHGTPMRRLIESGAVPGHRFVQIGLRGYWPEPETVAWMREQRMRSWSMQECVARGLTEVVDDALVSCTDGVSGVYVSVDIDVVDPAAAPGTGTPEPGGLQPRELLDTVRRLGRECHVIGADIVEVAPHYDAPADLTARLANRVVLELLTGIAERRRAAAGRSVDADRLLPPPPR